MSKLAITCVSGQEPESGRPLKPLPLPEDPIDATRTLPHNSIIDFGQRPISMMPTNVLLNWLYYHGLPMPKGASKAVLVQKVKLALAHNQELDHERISLDKAVNRKYTYLGRLCRN